MALVVRMVFTLWLLLLLICCQHAAATVVLDSSVVGMRQACPGEMVTYTCTVTQGFQLDWIVEPFLPISAQILFTSITPTGSRLNCSGVTAVQCEDFDFVTTLTATVNPNVVTGTTLADITSTLTFTAAARLNGTVVQCRGQTAVGFPINSSTLNVADLPSPPHTPSYTVQQYGRDSVTLTVQWQPPQYDGGAPVNYTITVSPGVGTFTTSGTSIMVAAVPYNVIHTVSIVATNCNGSSSAAMVNVPAIVNCSDPTPPTDGSIDPYHNTTEGAEISFRCDPGFVPTESTTAVCGEDQRWTPDPADHRCTFDCGLPVAPQRGSLESYTNTTEGSVTFYSCDQGLVPEGRMRANCTRNGWSPLNPGRVNCTEVNCGVPTAPENSIIENIQSISTVGGAQIFFRCNPRFVPAGRMSATCVSSDGISADGTWTSDPSDLVCNASDVVCVNLTLADGVTVREPYNTTVSSVIVYQCQTEFTPTPSDSVCNENGTWSPDPSEVECIMIPPTSMPSMSPTTATTTGSSPPGAANTGLGTGAIAGIAVVALVVVILLVAVIIIMVVVWRRRQSDVSSKPPPQSDDVAMYSVVPDSPKKPPSYKGYVNQGPGTEVEYTTIPDIQGRGKGLSNSVEYKNITGSPTQSKDAEAQYDLPPGSDHPQGLVYAQVDVKPKKKPTARPRDPKPPQEVLGVEYASIAYQPEDAAVKSQQAADASPKPKKKKVKKHVDADELLNLDVLLIQLQSVNAMWYNLGLALDVPDSILDDIKDQCKANPEQCMVEMVDSWITRQMHIGKPTWTDLAAGLRKIKQTWLADALENIYNTGVLPITVNMTVVPQSLFPDDSGAPPPIPVRGTLTDDVETPPPKPPKSWGSPPATKTEPSGPPWPHRAQ